MDQFQSGTQDHVYSIEELIERRVTGWQAEEWLFISMVGDLSILDGYPMVEKSNHYHGLHGCSVIVVASRSTANDGYEVADKLIQAGVANLGFWMLELPKIAELVFYGDRHQTPLNLFLGDEWARQVRQIAQGLAA